MAVFRTQSLEVASETSFAVNAANPSANTTWDYELPAENIVFTMGQPRIADVAMQDRQDVRGLSHPMARTCSVEFTTNLPGHSSDPAGGALTATWAYQLLGYALGGLRSAGSGSTISGAASTASSINVASVAGWVAGDFMAIGTNGDGRGGGQVVCLSAISATSGVAHLLTNAPAAPTTSGDTASRLLLVYHDETATLTPVRFRYMNSDTGAQYQAHGCQLAALKLSFPLDGNSPIKATWTYNGAYWNRSAVAFPNSTALEVAYGVPCTAGSMFLADFATKTRTTKTPATLELELEMPLAATEGPGGAGDYQPITGWTRTMVSPVLTLQIPWEAARETAWDLANQSYVYSHGLFTAHPIGGRRIAFYMPRMFDEGDRPSGVVNVNDLNYVTARWRGTESTDTTTALTRSAIRIGFG